jgi:hypothetical protein
MQKEFTQKSYGFNQEWLSLLMVYYGNWEDFTLD